MLDLTYSRYRMVERHLRGRGINNPAVLSAMGNVAREEFVSAGMKEFAYEDSPLAIDEGQTISQPYMVGVMIEAAGIEPGDAVLEVGTGSGYAAAVMSRIAEHVYSIERLAALAEQAERRLRRLGYRNIVVKVGDGTNGWPEASPFDAIIVAAAGPAVPEALKQQLAIGGRLVIPIGPEAEQRLIRITRTDQNIYDQEDFGPVQFVPMIGNEGWPAPDSAELNPARSLAEQLAEACEQLPDLDDPAFAKMFDRFANSRVVLLGEASHGTSEFYRARAAITQRLVEQHGFSIVAVEADWPDASQVDRHVRQRPFISSEPPFQRFPTWMWGNREFSNFVGWLRDHNRRLSDPSAMTSFHGLDIYNMRASIAAVLAYLDEKDPDAARVARERYGCLTPWQNEPQTYGRSALSAGYGECENAVVAQCRDLLGRQLKHSADDGDDLLDATQNARMIASAERYYRIMYYGGAESWNLRDTHMFETLEHLLTARGPDSKAVVWAHNSHIGDARHTDMGSARDEVNIGQLCRERLKGDVTLIGFGTATGKVAAATDWDGPMEIKAIRPALKDSYEALFHAMGKTRTLLDMQRHPALSQRLAEPRLERFIGVIYRPESERLSHYIYASLPQQFDAFVWFEETGPVMPTETGSGRRGTPETFPFGY